MVQLGETANELSLLLCPQEGHRLLGKKNFQAKKDCSVMKKKTGCRRMEPFEKGKAKGLREKYDAGMVAVTKMGVRASAA